MIAEFKISITTPFESSAFQSGVRQKEGARRLNLKIAKCTSPGSSPASWVEV